jgi:HAD superfamily hydrolase (TIGR01509 family)
MIKAAIFDMDGLLIDSEPLWKQTAQAVLKPLGRDLTDEQFNKTLGRGAANAVADWYQMESWQGATKEEVIDLILTNFPELVQREGKAKPGVVSVLELFKQKGLPAALASSSSYKIINTVLDTIKIREYFDVIYSAEDETHGKPHPGVFISAAKQLKVEPRDCLVFEDGPSGVLAAKAAHMHCVAVPDPDVKNNKFIQTADIILDSLEEFDAAMLKKLD